MRRVQRRIFKKLKGYHNEAVSKIADKPEILGIPGLNSEAVMYKIKFPELKKKGQETGDLIMLWQPAPEEWEILVAEITMSIFRSLKHEFLKLEMSFKYFRRYWQEWLERIGLSLPKDCSLWIRIIAISYAGKAPWEQPFRNEKRRKIS